MFFRALGGEAVGVECRGVAVDALGDVARRDRPDEHPSRRYGDTVELESILGDAEDTGDDGREALHFVDDLQQVRHGHQGLERDGAGL